MEDLTRGVNQRRRNRETVNEKVKSGNSREETWGPWSKNYTDKEEEGTEGLVVVVSLRIFYV